MSKWLDAYTGQTTDELIALAGEYRIDSIVLAFEQALDQKADRSGIDGFTEAEWTVLAVEALEREVNNGGYSQFFFNSSNEYAAFIVDALLRIGRPETAAITREALDILGIEGPLTAEAVERAMDSENPRREERLSQLDDQYYQTAGDLADPLFEYIKKNRHRIRLQ